MNGGEFCDGNSNSKAKNCHQSSIMYHLECVPLYECTIVVSPDNRMLWFFRLLLCHHKKSTAMIFVESNSARKDPTDSYHRRRSFLSCLIFPSRIDEGVEEVPVFSNIEANWLLAVAVCVVDLHKSNPATTTHFVDPLTPYRLKSIHVNLCADV